jgi:CubicO group peptidase (beta-lactamase class C family)
LGDILDVPDDKKRLPLRQCLSHTAGFPASVRLKQSIREINDVQLAYQPGSQVLYSDVGFLLLGGVIEAVTGLPLEQAVLTCTSAWGMDDTRYNPTDRDRCAATEWRDVLGRHQVGEVHDENATVLGGVAGHAGLFSTARDIAKYASMFLTEEAGEWFIRSRQCQTPGLNERRGLGWLLWQPGCFAGDHAGPDAFGHTGFTGTSLWIDPALNLVIVFLTNRVHFGRQTNIQPVREQIHTRIYEALKG